jgi:class 3 adenylate cyclase
MFSNEMVGNRIRTQREKRGLKQSDIANALQISPQAVSKWERGENAPDISVLVPLAKLLGISTDWLLSYHAEYPDIFEATVLMTATKGFTRRVEKMHVRDVADMVNSLLYQLTGAVLRFGGVPIKYMGDGILCFFSGSDHRLRSVQAAFQAKKMASEPVYIGLNTGEIMLKPLGHPDYARPDIIGDHVNLAFRTMQWAGSTQSRIGATEYVVEEIRDLVKVGEGIASPIKGKSEPVTMYEILGDAVIS